MKRIPVTLRKSSIRNPHIPVSSEYRDLFPPYQVEFELEMTQGKVTTYMTSGNGVGKYMSTGVATLFGWMGKVNAGDELFIYVVVPMKRYKLSRY